MSQRAPSRGTGRPWRGRGSTRLMTGKLDLSQAPDHLWRRLYICGVDDDLEKLHGYRPGAYCPVHLHDELHDGQYRVIHKLGHGGYATVWLCQDQHSDTPSYVAIKIIVANETGKDSRELLLAAQMNQEGIDQIPARRNLCLPLKQFTSQSPNGTHTCLVYPVLGPMVRHARDIFEEEDNTVEMLQNVSRQVVEALAFLHSCGICHADFRPSNILLGLQDLGGLDEEQVFSILGDPETIDVNIRNDSRPPPEIPYAPKYLVYPPESEDFSPSSVSTRTHIIDFGQSFDITQGSPPDGFGIPANYASPEVALDKSGGIAMDLWSLGCVLFEIRLGHRLFDVFQLIRFGKTHYMNEISSLLGEPPEQWMEYYTEFDDESSNSTTSSDQSSDDDEDASIDLQAERLHFIRKKLAKCHKCTGEDCAHPRFQLISETEAATFADLLERLLRYRPEERMSAVDVLKHEWFHTKY